MGEWLADGNDGAWTVNLDTGNGRWSAAVADGMGGHQAGELASETAILELHTFADALESEQTVCAVLERVNERVFQRMYAPRGRPGMGCTIAGVAVQGETAMFYNVGDSRAYLLRSREILQQSVDHTLRGKSSAQGRSHLLTQSLGGTSSRITLAPYIKRMRLAEDDVILLCSDGLTDMLSEDEILNILLQESDNPARTLTAAAVDAGGYDNVTVIVIGEEHDANAEVIRDRLPA
ncbi:MAG: protein phosphatase 2C domain-containing protein [Nisaea sp.]|uniref:PP2C family protein-serine/threonine phosphatase n=1 Tax=Nisaea sp. TaxID=2024842 RepID=UPI0032994889